MSCSIALMSGATPRAVRLLSVRFSRWTPPGTERVHYSFKPDNVAGTGPNGDLIFEGQKSVRTHRTIIRGIIFL
jgi:hypothetical protein